MESAQQYLEAFARNIAHEMLPSVEMKDMANHAGLLGLYAEAVVKRFIRRIVHPMRVSNGAVIDFPSKGLRQTDAIIWSAFPAPALFEAEDFAIVPRSNSFGVIEIKRSGYNDAAVALADFVQRVPELVADRGGVFRDGSRAAGMGVICILEERPSERMQKLFAEDAAVAIFERDEKGGIDVRTRDVLKLINFLQYVRWRYQVHSSAPSYPQIVV